MITDYANYIYSPSMTSKNKNLKLEGTGT